MHNHEVETGSSDDGGGPGRGRWLISAAVIAPASTMALAAAGSLSSEDDPVTVVPGAGGEGVAVGEVAPPVTNPPDLPDLPAVPTEADAAVVQRALGNEEIFLAGARIPLDAELISCVYPRGSGMTLDPGSVGFAMDLPASDGALAGALTTEHMAVACTGGGVVSPVELRAEEAVVCATDGAWVPEVTVLLDGRSCAEVDARPIDDGDLAVINQARAVEVRLLAVPSDDGCVTMEMATEWARTHSEGLPTELVVRSFDEGEPACYRPVTYWARGEILVQALGPQQ